MFKALLFALLEPSNSLENMQNNSDFTQLMIVQEELKTAPFGDIWNEYLERENTPVEYFAEVKRYEQEVLSKR